MRIEKTCDEEARLIRFVQLGAEQLSRERREELDPTSGGREGSQSFVYCPAAQKEHALPSG
jgi:hypothetical protein